MKAYEQVFFFFPDRGRQPATMSFRADDGSKPSTIKVPLHILIIPVMGQGHMIPMLDLARLLASRRVLVTFVSTPVNLARIRPIVDSAAASSLPIRFVDLHFPVAEFGIPDGCENTDLLPSLDLLLPFVHALPSLRSSLEAHLRAPDPENWPPPACIIADNLHHWAADVARTLHIPRLVFHGTSCFFLLCSILINRQKSDLEAALEAASGGTITFPGIPHTIPVSKQHVNPFGDSQSVWTKLLQPIVEVEKSADGVLVNSFSELEPWYLKTYREATGKPIWPVGLLSLYKEDPDVKGARGRVSSVDRELLFQWLDRKEAGSVVYVSFGSIIRMSMAQLLELGYGLEASNLPFIWVLKEAAEGPRSGLEGWLLEFEKRVERRGMVIREWAPQALILGHAAVGGFLTHCGWNSTLEAVSAGVVMATWAQAWDQYFNQSFVLDVLKTGVAIGIEKPILVEAVDGSSPGTVKVGREEVKVAVERLMGGGEEAEKRRERARELREKAKRAMEEGGSSWEELDSVVTYANQRKVNI